MELNSILSSIKQKKYHPLYMLHGEESYFIDLISDTIEKQVLDESQKGFDQTVIYGKDTDLSTIVSIAKRYPMMSEYQVVIVKEAQGLKWKDDEILQKYAEAPTPTTLLVFAHKHSAFDKRKKLYKLFQKNGVAFESKKLYDNQVSSWISEQFASSGRKIHPQAASLMADYLGTNLSKVYNEIEKLLLNVPSDREVVIADIEQNIGISKDFNVFELNNALNVKNRFKAFQIAEYLGANPKSNPIVLVMGAISNHFVKILKYHYLPDKSPNAVVKALGVNPYFVKQYETAARNYDHRKMFYVINVIKEYDLKFKGMNAGPNASDSDLLKEMVFKILQ